MRNQNHPSKHHRAPQGHAAMVCSFYPVIPLPIPNASAPLALGRWLCLVARFLQLASLRSFGQGTSRPGPAAGWSRPPSQAPPHSSGVESPWTSHPCRCRQSPRVITQTQPKQRKKSTRNMNNGQSWAKRMPYESETPYYRPIQNQKNALCVSCCLLQNAPKAHVPFG